MRRNLLLPVCITALQLNAQTKQIQYLSGTNNKNSVTWDFFCTGGKNSGKWTVIPVPSCWELQGFGNYNYGRDYKTYGKNFRFFDEKWLYKHSFQSELSKISAPVKRTLYFYFGLQKASATGQQYATPVKDELV